MKNIKRFDFSQAIAELKLRRGLKRDKDVASLLDIDPTHLSMLKNSDRVSEDWRLRMESLLRPQAASVPLDETDAALFSKWAARARMPLDKFVVDCVKRHGKDFASDRESDMTQPPRANSAEPSDAAKILKKMDGGGTDADL